MKYSVIIPVYNVEDKLRRCLDSLIRQSYTDYEVILVNDGSTDNSATVCQEYADNFAHILYVNKINGGASSARNVGLELASGKYVLFIDSDDYIEDNYFSTLDGKETIDGLTVFTYRIVNEKGQHVRHLSNELTDINSTLFETSKLLILSRTINAPYAKIFDRDLIEKLSLRFDEKMPVAEDFNFCLAYLMHCRSLQVFNTSVYVYDNTNTQSLVKRRKEGLIDIYPYVFNTAFQTVTNSSFDEDEKRQLYRIIDKLHTDSFATCVMEELKDKTKSPREIKQEISNMCEIFYSQYSQTYGYVNLIHFAVRFCIKHRFKNLLYYLSRIYVRMRG